MPTTTAVPSSDPSDLLYNAQKFDEFVNGSASEFITRHGVSRLTLTGALARIGYEAPVAFTTGLVITRATQTVTNGGNTYHANPAYLPFTTTSTFGGQWLLISNVTSFDLALKANIASPTFTGTLTAPVVRIDDHFRLSMSGGGRPVIDLDYGASTYLDYDRSTGVLQFVRAGVSRWTSTATEALARSTDATTGDGLPRKSQMDALAAAAAGGGSFIELTGSASGVGPSASFAAAKLTLVNASGVPVVISGASFNVSTAASGAGGVDSGSASGGTWYAVWAISDGTTCAGLYSLSATNPSMPSGYTHKRRVGWIKTDGTANKYPIAFIQRGRSIQWALGASSNMTGYPAVASGVQGSGSAGASTYGYAQAGLSSWVPSTAGSVALSVRQANAYSWAVAPNATHPGDGGAESLFAGGRGPGGSGRSTSRVTMPLETLNVYVWSDNADFRVAVTGWEDNL